MSSIFLCLFEVTGTKWEQMAFGACHHLGVPWKLVTLSAI